jgi:hypothetical protein
MAHSAEAPRYQLISPLYAGDEYIPIDEVIETEQDFIPNEGMIPLNEPAKEAFQTFMDSVNGKTPDLGDIVEQGYRNRPRHEITPVVPADTRKVEMRTKNTTAPLTGYDGNTQSMTAKKKAPVKSVGVADEVGRKGPHKVMGSVTQEVARGI